MKTKGITGNNIHTVKSSPSLEETRERMKKLGFFEGGTNHLHSNTVDNWWLYFYKMNKDLTTDFIIVKNGLEIEKTSENKGGIGFKISNIDYINGSIFYKKYHIAMGNIIGESIYKDGVQFTEEYKQIEKYSISNDLQNFILATKTVSGFNIVYGNKNCCNTMEFQRSPAHKNIDILSLYSSDNGGHFYGILEVEGISNEYHGRMLFSDKFKPFSIKGYDVCNSSPFSTNGDTLVILRPKNTKSNYKVLYNGKLVYEFRKKEFAQGSTDLISKKEDHKIPFMGEMIYIGESKVNFETLYIDTSTQRLVSVDRFKPNSFKIKGIIGDNEWTTVKILDDKYIEIGGKKFLKDLIKKIG